LPPASVANTITSTATAATSIATECAVRRSNRKPCVKRKAEEEEEDEGELTDVSVATNTATTRRRQPKEVKREQNKIAAKRYREKKKNEAGSAESRSQELKAAFASKLAEYKKKFDERKLMLNLLHDLYNGKTNTNYLVHFPEWFQK